MAASMRGWTLRSVALVTTFLVCSLWIGLVAADAGASSPAVARAEQAREHDLAKKDARIESAGFGGSWSALVESLASQLGLHTAYERARPPPRPEFTPRNLFPNTSVAVTSMESCVPVGVYLMARHGTRYPSRTDVERIKRMKDAGDAAVGFLKFMNEADTGVLHAIGIEEMRNLGKRMAAAFPTLFKYHPSKVKINSSPVHRASMSAAAFSQGAFNFTPTAVLTSGDIPLRPFDDCDSYKSMEERMKRMLQDQSIALLNDVAGSLNTTGSRLWDLWKVCRSQLNLRADLPPSAEVAANWIPACLELFYYSKMQENQSQDLLSFLLSREDLATFSLKAGGSKVNVALASPIVQSALSALLKKEISLNFAHAETLIPFACLLGLCGGEDGVGRKDHQKALDFWPSWISPFGANIAMVRLECDVPSQDTEAESHLPVHMGFSEKIVVPVNKISFSKTDLTAPPLGPCSWPWLSCDQAETETRSDLTEREIPRTVAEQKSAVEYDKSGKQIKLADLSKKSFVSVLHNELFVGLPGCDNMLLCPLDTFQSLMEKRIAEYDAKKFCPVGLSALVNIGSTKIQEFARKVTQLVPFKAQEDHGPDL